MRFNRIKILTIFCSGAGMPYHQCLNLFHGILHSLRASIKEDHISSSQLRKVFNGLLPGCDNCNNSRHRPLHGVKPRVALCRSAGYALLANDVASNLRRVVPGYYSPL